MPTCSNFFPLTCNTVNQLKSNQIKSNLSAGSEAYFIGYNCYHLADDTVKGLQEHKFYIKYLNWWK